MIKKLFLVPLLGILLIGCKTKKRVTYGSRNSKTVTQTPKKEPVKVYKEDDGLYPMPEDTGQFIWFEINSVQEYIDTFSDVAQREMEAFGIPASITLAQGLLESGFGKGALAKKTNNHFGIKCHKGWQGDYDFHDDDEKGECFRKYNHPMYSYRDHSLFLTGRSRYASLFELRNDDYKRWAKGLKQAGYATDKRYPQKLISLIEQHQLYKFDRANAQVSSGTTSNITRKVQAVSTNNNKIYVVKSGDTLYSISRAYSVSVDDLKRWNYMYSDSISVGQKLTVQTKNFN